MSVYFDSRVVQKCVQRLAPHKQRQCDRCFEIRGKGSIYHVRVWKKVRSGEG